MNKRVSRALLLVMVAGALLRLPFFFAPHLEGDERDAYALVDQLAQGRFSLRDTTDIDRTSRRAAYVDAPLYHNPPGFYALGWLLRHVLGFRDLYVISYAASLCSLWLAYRIAEHIGGARAALVSASLLLCCPITALAAGKVWVEPSLGALSLALVHVGYRLRERARLRILESCGIFLLGASITLFKQTGLAVLPCVVLLARTLQAPDVRRRFLLASVLGLLFGLLVFDLAHLWQTGSMIPRGALPSSDPTNAFVRMLGQRNVLSLWLLPVLLMPLYVYGWWALFTGVAEIQALLAWVGTATAGVTGLALLGIGTFHSKYIAFAMPALAVASGCEIARRFGESTPNQRLLLAVCFAYSAVFLGVVTFDQPRLAEIDPRFVFPVFEHLPW